MINRYNRYDTHVSSERMQAAEETQVRLVIRRGETRRPIRIVTGPVFTLGAAETCDLVLGDQQFPELHGYFYVQGHRVTLRQVGSCPLITVNGRAVRWGEVIDGDRIRTGPYEFLLRMGPPENATEQAPKTAWPGATHARLGPAPRWRSVTIDQGFSIRAKSQR